MNKKAKEKRLRVNVPSKTESAVEKPVNIKADFDTAMDGLEAALVALPEKRLVAHRFVDEQGGVCALGAVAVARQERKGLARTEALARVRRLYSDAPDMSFHNARNLGVAEALVREIEFVNDEWYWDVAEKGRYEKVLEWVRGRIK